MSDAHMTQIDERCRPGALKGLVKPRERYQVEKISDLEIRFRLLVPAENPPPRLIKRGGRTLLARGRVLTQAEVEKILQEFP
jgi:hypothetical protein